MKQKQKVFFVFLNKEERKKIFIFHVINSLEVSHQSNVVATDNDLFLISKYFKCQMDDNFLN